MEWMKQNIIVTIIGTIMTASLTIGGFLVGRVIDNIDSKPTENKVELMIQTQNKSYYTRLDGVEADVKMIKTLIVSIDDIKDGINKQGIDIAIIKTKLESLEKQKQSR